MEVFKQLPISPTDTEYSTSSEIADTSSFLNIENPQDESSEAKDQKEIFEYRKKLKEIGEMEIIKQLYRPFQYIL